MQLVVTLRMFAFAAIAVVAFAAASASFPGASSESSQGLPVQDEETLQQVPELPPEAPVAVVNGSPVSKFEYDRALRAYMQNFQRMQGAMHGGVTTPNDQIKADVLRQVVDRELLYQESKKFPLQGQEQLVDEEFQQIQSRFPSATKFQEVYEAEGLTETSLKDLIGRRISVRQYVEGQILPNVVVTEQEVSAFYAENEENFITPEQVRASHILLRVDPAAEREEKENALKRARDLQKQAASGADFAQLARDNSEDPGSAPNGGDLGFFTRDRMVKPFADAAFALEPDEVSDVVESRFGYHVIKLTDHQAGSKRQFAEVKGEIENYLKAQAVNRAVQGKVAELRKSAQIDMVAPHL